MEHSYVPLRQSQLSFLGCPQHYAGEKKLKKKKTHSISYFKNKKIKKLIYFYVHGYVLVYVHHMHADVLGGQERVSDCLELE